MVVEGSGHRQYSLLIHILFGLRVERQPIQVPSMTSNMLDGSVFRSTRGWEIASQQLLRPPFASVTAMTIGRKAGTLITGGRGGSDGRGGRGREEGSADGIFDIANHFRAFAASTN